MVIEEKIIRPPLDRNEVVPRLRRAFLTGTIALVAVALTFAGMSASHHAVWRWVLQSREVSRIAREASALATDRETGFRGFLLSGKEASLEPDRAARPALNARIDSLIEMTMSNVAQNEHARAIREALDRWDAAYATPTLARARTNGVESIDASDLAGKALFDNLRASFRAFLNGEERIYVRFITWDGLLEKVAFAVMMIEIVLLLVVLYGLRKGTLRQANELVENQEVLEEQATELEAQAAELEEQTAILGEQTDEARSAARALESTSRELAETVERLEHSKQAVQGIRRERQETLTLLDTVLESAPIGFAFHDLQTRYTRINAAFAAMSGRSAAEHVGRTPAEVYPEVAAAIEPRLREVVRTGQPILNFPLSKPSTGASGHDQHFLLSYFPIPGLDGSTQGVGTIVLETTERRLLEEQLLQAQKMEAIGRLAGGVAHDFNNILTAIKSYSELLIEDMSANRGRIEDVKEIREAADRAATLTRQLLAFSRQQILRPRVLDLNSTVRDLKSMLGRLIGADIELNTRLAPELGMLTADPGQVEQILVNLVINARDAMPAGGRIDIETANVELDEDYSRSHVSTPPGPYIMLAVSDTGYGMSREVQSRIFEPFFTTKEKTNGTGLGLSTVYGIVKQSGGSIWVYSETDRGTTFKIYLPRVEEKADEVIVVPVRRGGGGTETILLVEDEPSVRQVASRILRRKGYMVVEASNGAEALQRCAEQAQEFDLIITDIVMPEMGGLELARRVRQTNPDVLILFTSGYTEDAVQRRSFLEPGAAFIEKPFTPARLAQRTREVLDSRLTAVGAGADGA
jgi:two-component system, cell cycle sensor histidine kinase and response regulator CckA